MKTLSSKTTNHGTTDNGAERLPLNGVRTSSSAATCDDAAGLETCGTRAAGRGLLRTRTSALRSLVPDGAHVSERASVGVQQLHLRFCRDNGRTFRDVRFVHLVLVAGI